MVKPAHQGQLEATITKKAYADDTYKGHRVAQFNVKLTNNQYINFHNVHLVFPLKIKKSSDNNDDLDATLTTVNNFFAHWIKEIDVKRYGDDISILPLTSTVEIYKHSDAMLKYEDDEALKTYQNYLLYSNKSVNLPDGEERRSHRTNDANVGKRKDNFFDVRIDKFANQLKSEFYYRIPLRFLCDLGLVNQPIKFNTKWFLKFEIDYQRLFETKVNQTADALPNSVNVKIILTSTPYILFE